MQQEDAAQVYRVRDLHWYQFMAYAVGFAAIFIFSISSFFDLPVEFAIGFSAFWGAWLLLALLLWRWAHVSKLILTDNEVSYVGLFAEKSVEYDRVVLLRWRPNRDKGKAVISDRWTRLSLDFSVYKATDRLPIVEQLRARIPEHVQQDWDKFQAEYETMVEEQSGGIGNVVRRQVIFCDCGHCCISHWGHSGLLPRVARIRSRGLSA